jgi:parallel beta-helix repeat protein
MRPALRVIGLLKRIPVERLLFIFLLCASIAQGATYHVAKSGNDNNTCGQAQNPSTPKLSIRAGVNCATTGGDIVSIHAGTYTESVTTGSSGASGNPIRIQANGYTNDGCTTQNCGSGDVVVWTSAGTGNSSPALYIPSQSYIRIQGLQFKNTNNNRTIQIGDYSLDKESTQIQGIEILNNTFNNNGTGGQSGTCGSTGYEDDLIKILHAGRNAAYTGATVNSIAANTMTSNYGVYVLLYGSSDWHIFNNTASGLKGSMSPCLANIFTSNFFWWGSDRYTSPETYSERNLVENNTIGPWDTSNTSAKDYAGFRCDVDGRKTVMQNNIIHDQFYGQGFDANQYIAGVFLEAFCNDNTVKNNIIYNTVGFGIAVGGPVTTHNERNIIDGNVIYQADRIGIDLHSTISSTVKNNIVMNSGKFFTTVQVGQTSIDLGGRNVFQNNLYYSTRINLMGYWGCADCCSCGANLTLSQWNSASGETGSLNVNPLFVSPLSNFHLQAGSPAIGAGVNKVDMGAYPVPGLPSLAAPINLQLDLVP